MNTIKNETLVSFKEATRLIPTGNGRRVNCSTVWRWAMKGVKGVKLEYVCYGRAMFTTKDALERFANEVAEARMGRQTDEVGFREQSSEKVGQDARDERIRDAEEDCARYKL